MRLHESPPRLDCPPNHTVFAAKCVRYPPCYIYRHASYACPSAVFSQLLLKYLKPYSQLRNCLTMPITWSVAVPTLVGSLCSAVATSCVLLCYVVYADQQRSFRHVLVLNLALAGTTPYSLIAASTGQTNHTTEFINSVNNSVSGAWVVANQRDLVDGAACNLNGWVGQWSVQVSQLKPRCPLSWILH